MLPGGDWQTVAEFCRWLSARNLSTTTIRTYQRTLIRVSNYLDSPDWYQITRDDIERWLDTTRAGDASRYHYLSHLAQFFKWGCDEGMWSEDPTRRIPRPKLDETLPHFIPPADLRRAIHHAEPKMAAWITLGALAGLRCKEIAGLRAQDLRWELDPPMLIVSSPKGRRQRSVAIHHELQDALHRYGLPRRGFVFCRDGTNEPITPNMVSWQGGKYLREQGIDGSMHSLRHSFGTALYRQTRDIRLVQEQLGHRHPNTTAVYTHLAPSEGAEAVMGLPSLNGAAEPG